MPTQSLSDSVVLWRVPSTQVRLFGRIEKKRVGHKHPIISLIKHSLRGANWKTCKGEIKITLLQTSVFFQPRHLLGFSSLFLSFPKFSIFLILSTHVCVQLIERCPKIRSSVMEEENAKSQQNQKLKSHCGFDFSQKLTKTISCSDLIQTHSGYLLSHNTLFQVSILSK